MAIPRRRDFAPPPLPPPQYLPEISCGSDLGWQWANDPSGFDYGRPVAIKPGSSLLGGFCRPLSQERHRRSPKMIREGAGAEDEHGLQSEKRLEHTTFQGSSQAYDKQLLSRIGGPSTPRRQSLSGSSAIDSSLPQFESERRHTQNRINERLLPCVPEILSPRTSDGRLSRKSSVQIEEQGIFPQDEDTTTDTISYSPSSSEVMRVGCKRRASSPPCDSIESPRRRSLDFRQLQRASLCSSSSTRGPASLVSLSSLGMASTTSSATSCTSSALSPPPFSELDGKAYPVRIQPHSIEELSPQSAKAQAGPTFLCECCPKKPKKFETADELRNHESEKQYVCAYCPNRFKNKNEAERHQNSLHLRRHSWSCWALNSPQMAFHSSRTSNHDICGFCGQEFENPADWTDRTMHLQQAHKFAQCNFEKKFFRADHFRQHLKHSHDGTSGRWTNVLENTCMKDEPPVPKPSSMSETLPAVRFVVSPAGNSESTER